MNRKTRHHSDIWVIRPVLFPRHHEQTTLSSFFFSMGYHLLSTLDPMGLRVWPFEQYWIFFSLSRDHRAGQQEGTQVHALHHLPLRSADGPNAVGWPAHLRCGDPLWGKRPLSIYLPPLPPTGQGAAEPHTSAAGNQPCGTTLYPHPRQWYQGGELPWHSH